MQSAMEVGLSLWEYWRSSNIIATNTMIARIWVKALRWKKNPEKCGEIDSIDEEMGTAFYNEMKRFNNIKYLNYSMESIEAD